MVYFKLFVGPDIWESDDLCAIILDEDPFEKNPNNP